MKITRKQIEEWLREEGDIYLRIGDGPIINIIYNQRIQIPKQEIADHFGCKEEDLKIID